MWKGALLDNEQQYAALCVCTLLSDPFLSLSFVFVVILTLLFFFCVKDNKIIYFFGFITEPKIKSMKSKCTGCCWFVYCIASHHSKKS